MSPPPKPAKSNVTQAAIIIQLFDRGAFASSEEPSALSRRAPRVSADAERFAPKLAPPLRLPNTARELSAGFSSMAASCSVVAALAELADALDANVGSSPRSSLIVNCAGDAGGCASGKGSEPLIAGTATSSANTAFCGISKLGS